jgi:hypothetical protein
MAENNDIDIIEDEDNMDLASGADSYSFEDDERAKFESMESTEDGEDELETTDKTNLTLRNSVLRKKRLRTSTATTRNLLQR